MVEVLGEVEQCIFYNHFLQIVMLSMCPEMLLSILQSRNILQSILPDMKRDECRLQTYWNQNGAGTNFYG